VRYFNISNVIFDVIYLTRALFNFYRFSSHVGVYSNPQDVHATQDGNEMTNPAVPQVRAIDAFAPDDPARIEIVKSGVTASQILPGSGNVMGGQALQIKFKRVTTVENMRVKNGPVALKMACGEVRTFISLTCFVRFLNKNAICRIPSGSTETEVRHIIFFSLNTYY
jgi:hypothetical protein